MVFVPHVAVVGAGDPPASGRVLVLHGILGQGSNWRTFAKALAGELPGREFVLVDLRLHGAGASLDAPPPDTVEAAALDLVRLEDAGTVSGAPPVVSVLGHSFGGKVALAYAAARRRAGRRPLDALVSLDSHPGARPLDPGRDPDHALRVLDLLEALPPELPDRASFQARLREAGLSQGVVDWLAMNVKPLGDRPGYRFRLDVPRIRRLVTDYFARDAWDLLVAGNAARTHVVVGGRSGSFAPADRARLDALAADHPELVVHVLPEAGHWLHVDDPEGLHRILVTALAPLADGAELR